jgi:hypothetical protein
MDRVNAAADAEHELLWFEPIYSRYNGRLNISFLLSFCWHYIHDKKVVNLIH